MDDRTAAFLKSVANRMMALKDGKDNPDPEERVTVEQFTEDMQNDWGEDFRNLKVFPDWAGGTVIGVNLDFKWNGKFLPIKLITQNPNKQGSKFAEMARSGDSIVWLLIRKSDGSEEWRGRVHNGIYIPNGGTSMQEYVQKLTMMLPTIAPEHVTQMVHMAGSLGMLK